MGLGYSIAGIAVATAISMVVGFFWYSPLMFGKEWMKAVGIDMKKIKKVPKATMNRNYFLMLCGSVLGAIALYKIVVPVAAGSVVAALYSGTLVWLFVVPILLGSFLWEMKPIKLFLINALYWLVTILANSAMLVAWF
jgi:hypothetical protein